MVKLDGHCGKMMASMDSQLEKKEAAVDVFEERLDKMDTKDLEANWGIRGCSGATGHSYGRGRGGK